MPLVSPTLGAEHACMVARTCEAGDEHAAPHAELPGSQRKVGLVDPVNLHVVQLVDAHDAHVHQQGSCQRLKQTRRNRPADVM